jgi:hypothetical protein
MQNATGAAGEAAKVRHIFAGKVAPNLFASLVLVLVAGTMAGLTIGLLGIDPIALEISKASGGTEEERVQATAVWGVVARRHWLLCTLLLINAAANEALPLCLNEVAPPAAVVLVSVTLVLIFGEILPSAVFTGPRRLRLAAAMVPTVRVLMWVTAPVSWPLAMGLDRMLGPGQAETRLTRQQIATLIGLHLRETEARPPTPERMGGRSRGGRLGRVRGRERSGGGGGGGDRSGDSQGGVTVACSRREGELYAAIDADDDDADEDGDNATREDGGTARLLIQGLDGNSARNPKP